MPSAAAAKRHGTSQSSYPDAGDPGGKAPGWSVGLAVPGTQSLPPDHEKIRGEGSEPPRGESARPIANLQVQIRRLAIQARSRSSSVTPPALGVVKSRKS